jgi:FKBP-type peptidyl-prolyl cis-trans isomerase
MRLLSPSLRSSSLLRIARLPRAVAAVLLALSVTACVSGDAGSMSGPSDPATETFAGALNVNLATMTQRLPRLYVQDVAPGSGAEAASGNQLRMRYTGWLRTGQQFDSNANGPEFAFRLGAGQVIQGWDLGIVGMKVGGKRRLVFGSEYGYGARGSGPIPANATLVFDVELLGITN